MKILIRCYFFGADTGFHPGCHDEGVGWGWHELGSETELEFRKEALATAKKQKEILHWQVKYAGEPKKPTPFEFLSAVGEPLDGWKVDCADRDKPIAFGDWNKNYFKPIKDELEEG